MRQIDEAVAVRLRRSAPKESGKFLGMVQLAGQIIISFWRPILLAALAQLRHRVLRTIMTVMILQSRLTSSKVIISTSPLTLFRPPNLGPSSSRRHPMTSLYLRLILRFPTQTPLVSHVSAVDHPLCPL